MRTLDSVLETGLNLESSGLDLDLDSVGVDSGIGVEIEVTVWCSSGSEVAGISFGQVDESKSVLERKKGGSRYSGRQERCHSESAALNCACQSRNPIGSCVSSNAV
jgi:hypothetical protein